MFTTAGVSDHGAADPVSKPGLPSFWPEQPPPPPLPIVQLNDALPVALALSRAVTLTL